MSFLQSMKTPQRTWDANKLALIGMAITATAVQFMFLGWQRMTPPMLAALVSSFGG